MSLMCIIIAAAVVGELGMVIRGQVAGPGSLFPLCGSGIQAMSLGSRPAEPSSPQL